MADKVTQKDGKWSDTTVWNGGSLPTSGQTVQISHNVIFDVDQSGMAAGLGAMSIDAGKSITASTSAGAYVMKLAGTVTGGAGSEIRAGDAVNAYPSNCTFLIYHNGNYSIDGGVSNTLTLKLYCYDPPVKYLRLISATPKAITGISKGTSCTVTCVGHGYSAGDTIYLVNVGGMVELNNLRVKVKTVVGVDSFTIRAYDADVVIDSTNFTTYTTGGYACPETAEAAGQTQLEVDQNVSADAEWARAGATVNIDNVARAKDSEARTLASLASGSVTVTAGLTAAKHSSALVILTSRNVTLQSSATNIDNGIVWRGAGHVLRCAIKSGNAGTFCVYNSHGMDVGAVCSNGGYAIQTCNNSTLSGISTNCIYGVANSNNALISGLVSAASYGVNAGCGMVVSGDVSGSGSGLYQTFNPVLTGTVKGCGNGFYQVPSVVVTGSVMGCTRGLNQSGKARIYGANFVGNQFDFDQCQITSTNSTFQSSVESYNYSLLNHSFLSDSFDHDKVTGAYRAWTRGGIVSSTATNPPSGRVRSYRHVCESASFPCWHQREIVVDAGRQLRVRVWLKGDAGVEIKAQLVLPTADPLITGTGTGEWQQIGTSDTAWHEYVTSWTNSATYPVTIYLRFLATAASGNGYSDFQWAFDRTPLVR